MLRKLRKLASKPRLFSSLSLPKSSLLDIHPEVQDALHASRPVVALETTLVTHGIPFPLNVELALSLENIVRSTGAIPATIGIIGKLLSMQDISRCLSHHIHKADASKLAWIRQSSNDLEMSKTGLPLSRYPDGILLRQ